jgi:hypothetical protein
VTALAITLAALSLLLGAALVYFARRALNAGDATVRAVRSEIAMERMRDAAVKGRDSALTDAVREKTRAEQAVDRAESYKLGMERAEERLHAEVEKRLDSADPADVARVVAELLAQDLRDPADAARAADGGDRGADAAAVRSAAGAGSGGGS